MITAATGAAFTGTVTVYVTGDRGTQAIGSVGSGLCTLEGHGYYTYAPAQAETNYDLIAFTFIGTGAVPQTLQVETVTETQVSALGTATGTVGITVQDLIVDALEELRVIGSTREATAEDLVLGLRRFNRMVDGWNAEPMALYATGISTNTITPSLQPHTIGPSSATWSATQRPSSIKAANLLVSGLRYPLWIRQADWWMNWIVQLQFTSSIPTSLYYNPTWPNGEVYLWPIPTTAYSVELLTDSVLGTSVLTDVLWLPPGYQEALTLSLCEILASPFGVGVDPGLKANARAARARIFEANVPTPPIQTADVGLNRPWGWNNYTGTWTP